MPKQHRKSTFLNFFAIMIGICLFILVVVNILEIIVFLNGSSEVSKALGSLGISSSTTMSSNSSMSALITISKLFTSLLAKIFGTFLSFLYAIAD